MPGLQPGDVVTQDLLIVYSSIFLLMQRPITIKIRLADTPMITVMSRAYGKTSASTISRIPRGQEAGAEWRT